eukprot:6490763-Amphidinium_carterae.2
MKAGYPLGASGGIFAQSHSTHHACMNACANLDLPRPRPYCKPPKVSLAALRACCVLSVNTRSLKCDVSDDLSLRSTARWSAMQKYLVEEQVDIALMQETRMHSDFVHSVEFDVAAANPEHGLDGLIIAVRKAPGFRIRWQHQISRRVLLAAVQVHGHTIVFVSGHAPVSEAPMACFDAFLCDLRQAHHIARQRELPLFLGLDMNTRLQQLEGFWTVGPL